MAKKKGDKAQPVKLPEQVREKHEIARLPNGYFAPGVSANPAGRPKRVLPSEVMYWMAAAIYEQEFVKSLQAEMPEPWKSKDNLTLLEIHTWLTIRGGLKGKDAESLRREVRDRIEGKPTMKISGPDGGPFQMQNVPLDLKKLTDQELIRWSEGTMTFAEMREIVARIGSEE